MVYGGFVLWLVFSNVEVSPLLLFYVQPISDIVVVQCTDRIKVFMSCLLLLFRSKSQWLVAAVIIVNTWYWRTVYWQVLIWKHELAEHTLLEFWGQIGAGLLHVLLLLIVEFYPGTCTVFYDSTPFPSQFTLFRVEILIRLRI